MTAEGKVCTKCGDFKAASDFSTKRWTNKDGVVRTTLKSRCKPCHVQSEKERINASPEVKARNLEQTAQARRNRIARMTEEEHAQYAQKMKAWGARWRQANPETVKATKARHRDRSVERQREYYYEHRAEISAKWKAYYQRKRKELLSKRKDYTANPAVQERLREYRRLVRAEERLKIRQKIADLNDNYVKGVLRQTTGLVANQISQALVEAKKLQLKIWRMTHEKR
jgi:hypothetical protein